MTKLEMAEKLQEALRLFRGGKSWGRFQRVILKSRATYPTYCAVGAVEKVAGEVGGDQLLPELVAEVRRAAPGTDQGIMAYNDSSLKYINVANVFKATIKRLKAEAAAGQ
jgi:hypothetical protein